MEMTKDGILYNVTSEDLEKFGMAKILKDVRAIGVGAFKGCFPQKKLIIPSSVETIADEAFVGSLFKTVVIGKSVKKIGHKAFGDCPFLKRVVFLGESLDLDVCAFKGSPDIQIVKINESCDINLEAFRKSGSKIKCEYLQDPEHE